MSYVLVEKLTKTIRDRILLDEITFAINAGDKIALVAQNGSGKSTLLKIVNEQEQYDSGRITKQNGVTWGFLEQEPELNHENTIDQEIYSSPSPLVKAVKLYAESLKNPEDNTLMSEAHEQMNKHNAWQHEEKIREIIVQLKLNKLSGKIGTLSGGQRKRVALAKVLIDNPDFLIMDEPTNHIDLEMIAWLEEYLTEEKVTLLLVSHDRYFIDRVCNQILELSRGKIYKHQGNYSRYLYKKEEREQVENTNIDRTNAYLRHELEWVKKGPKARLKKSSARVDAYYKLKESVGTKNDSTKVKLDTVSQRLGGKILELHNIDKSFETKVILSKFNYTFVKGEKLGIIGKNGVGKTTFLNIIMGIEPTDSGKIITGETVKFGYYSQHQENLNPNHKVIDAVKSIASYIKLSDGSELSASKLLERFLFPAQEQQKLVGDLSGGEKKRIALLQVLMANPNFLILDEPTNDFDLMTLDVLEEFLQHFKGCLILISHDRYFMDAIVDHLFVFEGDGIIQDFPGNYSQYREINAKKIGDPQPYSTSSPLTRSQKSTQAANDLYKEITKLEKKKEKLQVSLNETGDDYLEAARLMKEIKVLQTGIDAKTEEWFKVSSVV